MGMCENLYGTLNRVQLHAFCFSCGTLEGNKWDCDPKGAGQECHIDKHCPLKWGTPIMSMHEGSTLFIIVN